jgi:hypothetical protein
MHYKNGRPAKSGDSIVDLDSGVSGILHSPTAQSDTCNGRIAVKSLSDPYVTLKNCLHVDDIKSASVPDSSFVNQES